MIDFHSHIIPGVDDGSETLEQSLRALREMRQQGITHVITTPHFQASTIASPAAFESRIAAIDGAWATLVSAAGEKLPRLELSRGVELALDEPLAGIADERLRLAGTRFALVEFPYFTIPSNSGDALLKLRGSGVTPIVAHPERYSNVDEDLAIFGEWKRAGAFLQLNAGSLVGAYGAEIESRGWKVLERGFANYISSDYHARGKCLLGPAADRIRMRGGDSQIRALSLSNPTRLLRGEDPIQVDRLPGEKGAWRRLRSALKGAKP